MPTPLSERERQAFFLCGKEVSRLAPSQMKAPALPDALVVPPGDYEVFGESFEMRREGLYRFIHPRKENRQCVVFREDMWALMSAVSWLGSHGYRDNEKSYSEKLEIARTGKLVVTCGDFSVLVTELFDSLGLSARVVGMTTLIQRNGHNDGHVLNEVLFDGRWIAFDADQGRLYREGDKHLNLLELIVSTRTDGYTAEPLTATVPLAVGHFTRESYAYDLWMETCLSTPALYREIMSRLMGVPIMIEDGVHYFTAFTDADRHRAEELYSERNMQFLQLSDFKSRYYPKEGK